MERVVEEGRVPDPSLEPAKNGTANGGVTNGAAAALDPNKPAEAKKTVRRVGAKPPVEREPRSLYICGLKNPIRKKLIEIVEWKVFEMFILLAIVGTCLCLAVFTPMPNNDTNAINEFLVSVKLRFTRLIIN